MGTVTQFFEYKAKVFVLQGSLLLARVIKMYIIYDSCTFYSSMQASANWRKASAEHSANQKSPTIPARFIPARVLQQTGVKLLPSALRIKDHVQVLYVLLQYARFRKLVEGFC